jgi:peroxiredoxin
MEQHARRPRSGVNAVFGLSTQDTLFQKETKERLGLLYDLLGEEKLAFLKVMNMPIFEWEGRYGYNCPAKQAALALNSRSADFGVVS